MAQRAAPGVSSNKKWRMRAHVCWFAVVRWFMFCAVRSICLAPARSCTSRLKDFVPRCRPATALTLSLELADRAADEEARRISSELGIVASLRVTCRLHVVEPDRCNRLSASRLWCLCVVSVVWELRGTYADRTSPPACAAPTRCFSNGVWVHPTGAGRLRCP